MQKISNMRASSPDPSDGGSELRGFKSHLPPHTFPVFMHVAAAYRFLRDKSRVT